MRLSLLLEGIRIGLLGIRTNAIRSGLTILGVTIGVAVVVTMAAIVGGIRSVIVGYVDAAGPNNFNVMQYDWTDVQAVDGDGTPGWLNPQIISDEAIEIASLPVVSESLYAFDLTVNLSWNSVRLNNVFTRAFSSGWPAYSVGSFTAGRDFVEAEVREARPVAVISARLAEELFGVLEPIGKDLRLRTPQASARFTVIGVFGVEENIFTAPQPHWIIIPWTSAKKHLDASERQAALLVVPHDSVSQAVAEDQVIAAMRGIRGLSPREENNFAVLRSDQFLEFFDQLTGIFFMVMIGLSSVGLMVGGVGVIGIMLISVTERTREIGVRKALGATRREILWQFLVEAAALTTVGGAAGLAVGGGGAWAIAHWTPVPAVVPLWSVIAALAMAAVTGVLFGIFPAVRAARMAPVAALRHER